MWPVKNSTSVPQTPARSTSTTTWPGPGTGGSMSRTAACPGPVMTNARMRGLVPGGRVGGGGNVHGVPNSRSRWRERETMPELRSDQWYGGQDRDAYIHRAWMRRGLPDSAFTGRPQIAIANTASDLVPCNRHLSEVAQHVTAGVWEAGGVPLEMPVVSLGETNVRPTAMLWRNMAAMAIEEMIRANPIDGVVLLGGCDKTIPALLMGAASVDLPAVVVPGGPMLNGTFRGELLGCGTDVWRLSEEVRAGTLDEALFLRSESSMIRSRGHCNTMGTASTMGIMAEALGMTIPGIAGTPAPDSRLLESAHEAGRLAVELARTDRRISTVVTKESFHNA